MTAALDLIARSGAVGAGGAGFPTHVKLAAKVEYLIANAAECEPLLYTNQELLHYEAPQVVAGLLAAADMVRAQKIVVAIKGKYKTAIAALEQALAAAGGPPVAIVKLPDYYPAGDEHAIVSEVTGRIVPEAGLPLDVGCVVSNVETLANVAAAIRGTPVTEKWVTVTGAVRSPITLKAPVGTPMSLLIAAAGGPTIKDWGIVEGGPMMGKVVLNPETPITKTTGGIIVLPREHSAIARPLLNFAHEARRTKTTCIRCTLCTELCPRYLEGHDLRPHAVMQSLALFPMEDAVYDQAWLCCECGICEVFSCPMGLSPRLVLGHIKREFAKQGRRYPKTPKNLAFRRDFLSRRIPGKRLLHRMGLDEYDRPAPYGRFEAQVTRVKLMMRQHIGMVATPTVAVGDRVEKGQLVGEVPQGKLGAPIHASMSGVVTEVGQEWVTIEEVSARA